MWNCLRDCNYVLLVHDKICVALPGDEEQNRDFHKRIGVAQVDLVRLSEEDASCKACTQCSNGGNMEEHRRRHIQ